MAARPTLMLDTDTASFLIRGGSAAADARLRDSPPGSLCISVVTRAELLLGTQLRPEATRLGQVVGQFLARMPSLPWTDAAATSFAAVSARLHRTGQPIGTMDAMIAAHALAEDLPLVTHNLRHFSRIPGLRLQDWLV